MIKLINGDCLELMKDLSSKSIDITFTSPPFKEEDVKGDYWEFYDKFFNEVKRITKNVIVIFHSSTKLNTLISKYPPDRILIWAKSPSWYTYRYNPILVYQLNENYKINKYIWSDCFTYPAINNRFKKHRYADPEIVYRSILSMFKNCNTVLDPFMGSGTTAAVCKQLNKSFIGFEIDRAYFDLANKKVSQAVLK